MNKAEKAVIEIKQIDELADGNSYLHHISPLSKLVVTLAYLLFVMSCPKYAFSTVLLFILYPISMYAIADLSLWQALKRMRFILPLIIFVNILNPFFDQQILLQIGGFPLTGGIISFITTILKGILVLWASYLLVATTKMDALCQALRQLHIPKILVSLFLLTYRYLGLMMEEVSRMSEAYYLRAPDQKGIHISAWGSFLGQLLLRSMDRATEIFHAMKLRGYIGEYRLMEKEYPPAYLYFFGWLCMFVLFRLGILAEWIGGIFL
ncbi:MAG: cobalt ECF transporter T component CbiQ [Solobacterium sp.]|nr:cobalt ECF transporter T component CbiQ [Solobacterium sp.]